MPIISINIPQLGEGLQEARLIEFLKQPGDRVERCLLYTSPSPRDRTRSRMPSSA